MTEQFELNERLFRAVYPPEIMPMFWKENGKISSAVFKDKNGLSVERAGGRTDDIVMNYMISFFYGTVIGIYVKECVDCGAVVRYLPTKRSRFHSEIHGSEDRKLLNQSQCKYLAEKAYIL